MQETDGDIDALPAPVDLDEVRLVPRQPPPERRRRGRRMTAVLLAILLLLTVAVGFVAAVRFGLVPVDALPEPIRRLIFPPAEEAPPPPVRPVDPIRALPEAQRRQLFDPDANTTLRFARSPYIDVSRMCALMNLAGLSGAVWAPDPVIPAEWACFTAVLEIADTNGAPQPAGGAQTPAADAGADGVAADGVDGDAAGGEAASTVFGLIRGRNRGVADVLRVTVIEGGPATAARARMQGVDVIRSILDLARLRPPAGFLDAAVAGTAFLSDSYDWRFQVNRPEGATRVDIILVAKAQPGLIPSDWFSGRVPRMAGDPLPGTAGVLVEDLAGTIDDTADGDDGLGELPPGFVADDPDAGAGVTVPELEDLPPDMTDPAADGTAPADGEAPIENLAR
jgi:hypothetical protein